MSRYSVLLYDKDNDIYTTAASTDNLDVAYIVAKAFNKFVHRDMILNIGYDYKEPYDYVYIADAMYKENNLLYVNEE